MSENKLVRLYVEKKKGFNVEAINLFNDIKENLQIKSLEGLRVINWYDIEAFKSDLDESSMQVFFEAPVDNLYEDEAFDFYKTVNINKDTKVFAVSFLKGQFDSRAHWAMQCLKLLKPHMDIEVKCAKIYVLEGNIKEEELLAIKRYMINPVDSEEKVIDSRDFSEEAISNSKEYIEIEGFTLIDEKGALKLKEDFGLAMTVEDILFTAKYFTEEGRNPSITELRVIDTYWSDHCRHTTFSTEIKDVKFNNEKAKKAYEEYMALKTYVYENKVRPVTLMDMATIGMKAVRKRELLKDLDSSKEINACSLIRDIDIDGKKVPYSIQFKNETHNHPTEIEPFGGAATCLGGAIRDPLAGRAYVYQAIRVTGSSDPREKVSDTISGKLPSRKICLEAAHGYSSYGNQIGLCTGFVDEIYHKGYRAKRMEVGAVIGAAPLENIKRLEPVASDIILLLGGRTGRDGVGGATGSSKIHDESSLKKCGAEVQKGNAVTERKIQRLFRNGEATKLIKRCNDFGAGGVSVAMGELSDGVFINLDKVPTKYSGINGTELAISESQERMAIVVAKEDADKFITLANDENLECTKVGEITEEKNLVMVYKNETLVNIKRKFLESNGVTQKTSAVINSEDVMPFFHKERSKNFKESLLDEISDINVCSKKGLMERFDSSIGRGTVLMPFGGKYELTPNKCAVSKIPVLNGTTSSVSFMSYGYNPVISNLDPFIGSIYAVIESIACLAGAGAYYKNARLSFQEFFARPVDAEKFGDPMAALLGALWVQNHLNIPAIGGKDSMSGTFNEINVPKTLISFAFNTGDIENVISPELKEKNSKLILLTLKRDKDEMPDLTSFENNMEKLYKLIKAKKVLSASSLGFESPIAVMSKMSFGNKIGFEISDDIDDSLLFNRAPGEIILEVTKDTDILKDFDGASYVELGKTTDASYILYKDSKVSQEEVLKSWLDPLETVYKTKTKDENTITSKVPLYDGPKLKKAFINSNFTSHGKPKVLIPVFPGSNCEYDLTKAFTEEGAEVHTFVFKNASGNEVLESIEMLKNEIKKCNILSIPGGFSASDEPEGSGKFIAAVLRNEKIKDSINELIKKEDGLIIGICNGFQALVKVGLLPYGEISSYSENSPTLTYNTINRHMSNISRIKVVSNLSPWFNMCKLGEVYGNAVSHGEGRFVGDKNIVDSLIKKGQVATLYVDEKGNESMDITFNPNGSISSIEGITSVDGRVLGKMGHVERYEKGLFKNIPLNMDMEIIKSGVNYFTL